MSHEIEEFSDGTAAFVSARKPAWHHLGVTTTDAMTAKQALDLAQLSDWDVRKSQLYVTGADGEPQAVPDRFATVRTNPVTKEVDALGLVSDRYEIFQNEDLAQTLDTIVDVSGAHFETAGSLKGGKRVFVNMKLPNGFTVAGKDSEKHEIYLLGTTTHDGKAKIQFVTTPVRVVCQNTLTAGLNSMITQFGVSHRAGMEVKVQEVREALEVQYKAVEDFQAEAERMLDAHMSDHEFSALVNQLWAPSTSPASVRRDDKLQDLWKDAPTLDGIRNTNWGAWQAVTEYVDHYDSPTGTDINRAMRAVDGTGLARKEKAYQLLAV